MIRLFQVIQVLGLNSVLLGGVLWAGWSDGTAISLFWCETVFMIPFVSLRIILHRRATNKRGHYVTAKVRNDEKPWETRTVTLNSTYVLTIVFVTFVMGIFIAVALYFANQKTGTAYVDIDALKHNVPAVALLMAVGFGLDLIGIGRRPFAWVSNLMEGAQRRIMLFLGTGVFGLPLAFALERPKIIFGFFGGLKLLMDLGRLFPQQPSGEAPHWMARIFGSGFRDFWRSDELKRRQWEKTRAAACEEPFDGWPMAGSPEEHEELSRLPAPPPPFRRKRLSPQMRLLGVFGSIVISLWFLGGISLIYGPVCTGLHQGTTSGWTRTEGVIVDLRTTGSGNDTNQPPFRYRYEVNGKVYTSSSISLLPAADRDHEEWLSPDTGLPKKDKIDVYYNPRRPDESVLKTGYQPGTWSSLLDFDTLIHAGLGIFLMTGWLLICRFVSRA